MGFGALLTVLYQRCFITHQYASIQALDVVPDAIGELLEARFPWWVRAHR